MVDSACAYIKSLSMTGGGTNFSANDYAKNIVIISLIPEDIQSQRELARRLGVPRNLITQLVTKRNEFNLIAAKDAEEKIITAQLEDDESLEKNSKDFAAELEQDLAGQGLFLLFNAAFPDKDADIYFEEGLFYPFLLIF
jgi:transcriptional regulator with XRE-family HTH domain